MLNWFTSVEITVKDLEQAIEACNFPSVDRKLAYIIVDEVNRVIKSRDEAAMFLAQLIHESGGFQYKEEKPESRNGQPYGNYYGRGFIQLTWEDNYRKASRAIYDGCESELLRFPDKIVSSDYLSMRVSSWYWKEYVQPKDAPGKKNFFLTTLAINGALENDPDDEVPRIRYGYYRSIAKKFGVRDLAANKYP